LLTIYYSDNHVKEDEMSGQVACVGKKRNAYKYLVGNLKERNHLEDLVVDGRMTLKRTLNKQDARVWARFI
jgi:hypothetical protein